MKFSRNDLTRILCQSFESSVFSKKVFSEDSDRRQPALYVMPSFKGFFSLILAATYPPMPSPA